MRPVIFSHLANQDLLDIGEFIAEDNPARAIAFAAELRAKAEKIGFSPRGYPPREDLRKGLRMAVHGHYLILFEIGDAGIHILRIVHGARDLPRLFGK